MSNIAQLNRRSFMLAGATTALAASACQTAQTSRIDGWNEVERNAQWMVNERYAPGLSISVMKDGQVLYSKAFGLANIENPSSMKTTSVFKIASITKQMTAASLLLLQEDGKLNVQEPLSAYIPEFTRASDVTLYQLATHTSGLGSYNRLPTRDIDRLREYDDDEYLELMKRTDPMFVVEPGQDERYSNTGYALLGIVIGRVAGMHYSEFFQERLFDPLNLQHTMVNDQSKVIADRVAGYSPNAEQPTGFERAIYTSVSFPGPGGSVVSTTEDLCQWHSALIFGDLLQPKSLAQMLAPVELPEKTSHYGMGLLTKFPRPPFEGRYVASHGGRLFGFAADLWSFPDNGVTVATMFNSDGGDKADFGKRFDSVRDPATQIALGEYLS